MKYFTPFCIHILSITHHLHALIFIFFYIWIVTFLCPVNKSRLAIFVSVPHRYYFILFYILLLNIYHTDKICTALLWFSCWIFFLKNKTGNPVQTGPDWSKVHISRGPRIRAQGSVIFLKIWYHGGNHNPSSSK